MRTGTRDNYNIGQICVVSSKLVAKSSIKDTLHPKHVASLPCEIYNVWTANIGHWFRVLRHSIPIRFLANVILTFTFAICYRNSVCLSSVTLVHPTQAVEIFGNFFHHTQGL